MLHLFLRIVFVLSLACAASALQAGVVTTSGITLAEEGGTFAAGNLATSGTAFAKDEIGVGPHSIPNLNNGSFGNSSSWIAGTRDSFVGINLGASPVAVSRVAFGRDSLGMYSDRNLGTYTLQYTTAANPGANTADSNWTTIGTLDYQSPGGTNFGNPAIRHVFAFPTVMATGIRLKTYSSSVFENIGIDELELYADTTPPVIAAHPNVTATATGSTGVVVTYDAASATDDSGLVPTISYSQASGTLFAAGVTTVTITATDAAGNTATSTFTVTVNTVNNIPSFTKGEDKYIHLGLHYAVNEVVSQSNWATGIDDGDSPVTQSLTFNVTNDNNALFTTQPAVSSTGTLTFTPNGNLGIATVFVTLTDDNTINGSAALTTAAQAFTITISDGSSPLVSGLGGVTAFTEGADAASTPVVVGVAITVTDPDSITLASATVSIAANFQSGQDVLAFTNDGSTMGDISGSYDPLMGVLELTSSFPYATIAQWQQALRAVTYMNSSDAPSTSPRTVRFVVRDSGLRPGAGTRSLSVTAANDSPVATVPASISMTAHVAGALTGISFGDVDAGTGTVGAVFTVGPGTLSATSGSGVTVGGSGTGSLTLAGTITSLNAFIAASNVTFTSALNATGNVTLTSAINDNGNTGLGGAKSDIETTTLTVQTGFAGVVTTGGIVLLEEGGTIQSGNLAATGTAFSQDEIGVAPHATAKVNDATFGNSSSWIAGTANSFIGMSLGSTPRSVNQIAFGRDNSGALTDRCLALYELQYTTVANPNAATSEASWISIGTLDYQGAGGTNFASPALRHRFAFDAVNATGFRLRMSGTAELICIDELELYHVPPPAPVLLATGGSFLANNLATTGTAFAKDVVGVAPHAIASVNDGTFGNPSSWIAGSLDSFIGISLGATPVSIDRLAFGRDNTVNYTDRVEGTYTFQFTTVPNPNAATPNASWTSFAQVTLPLAGDPSPALRHLFQFTPVSATGIRIRTQSAVEAVAMDELELYAPAATGSTDPSLSGLVASSGALSPVFAAGTTAYSLPTFSNATSSLSVTPTATQSGATVKVNGVTTASGSSAVVALTPGNNTITVLVTAPDGVTTRSYTISVHFILGLTLVQEGDQAGSPNIARESVITASSQVNSPPHGANLMNDGIYGDGSAWNAASPTSAVVVNLGTDIVNVSAIAWGRDNTGVLTDRWRGLYIIEYTQAENPGVLTPDEEWQTIGSVDYATLPQTGDFSTPARRHRWSFPAVQARGIRVRVVTASGEDPIAMDELELYTAGPWLVVEGPGNIPLQRGASPIQWAPRVPRQGYTDTFTIRNVGSASLTDLALTGGGSGYTYQLSGGTSLAPGASAALQVSFVAPYSLGLFNFNMTVGSSALINKPRSLSFGIQTQVICDGANVLRPPRPPFTVGVPVDFNPFDVRGVSHPDSHPGLNYSGNLGAPAGLGLDQFGRLSGTPTSTGRSGLSTHITDALGCLSRNETYWMVVLNVAWIGEGGTILPRNIAAGGTAFAKDNLGVSPHAPSKINDGLFGNASSWIAGSKDSFVGVSLGSTPLTLNKLAFGRDNTLQTMDRGQTIRTLQYTTVPNPDASTPEVNWTTLEVINFAFEGWGDHQKPQYETARVLFSFQPIQATGFRIKVEPPSSSPTYDSPSTFVAIDELELYGPDPAPVWRTQHFGAATANIGDLDDFDGDGVANLLEFAQGTLPNNAARRQLSYTGNVITPGQPVADGTNAVFIRRKDRIAAGLVYTVEFSPDLTTWTPVSTTPTVLADDGTNEVVSVPMPPLDARHFFRVRVNSVP